MDEFGKFKNAEDLYKAYINLEKEHTKVCQKLGDLEKSLEPKFAVGEEAYGFVVNCGKLCVCKLPPIKEITYSYLNKKFIKIYTFDCSIGYKREEELFKSEEEAKKKLDDIRGEIWKLLM